MRLLVPDRTYAGMIEVFQGRATYDRIKHWRKGRARPPEWARQMAADQLKARADPLYAASYRLLGIEKKPAE